MSKLFFDFAAEKRGAVALEYALLAMFIAMALISGGIALGSKTGAILNTAGNGMK
jgi:Flp pilus assembly pilin Flp